MSARRLVLGTVQWGLPYGIANRHGVPDDAELAALLAAAAAAGVRELDTARAYGESEARLGRLVAPGAGRFAIGTKLAPDVAPPGADAAEVRARTAASLAASRAALGRTRLDAVLLHRAAHRRAAGGAAWELLRAERRAGRIGRLGVSAASPAEAWAALADPEVERVQVATSLLDQRLWRAGFFARARQLRKEVHVRSVFLQGVAFLAPDALPEALAPLRDPLARIHAWAAARGLGPADPFLLFARGLRAAACVVGAERAAQLDAQLAAWRRPALGPGERAALAGLVPALPDALLDPAQWPARPASPAPAAAPDQAASSAA